MGDESDFECSKTLSYPVKWGEGWVRETTEPVVWDLLHLLPS